MLGTSALGYVLLERFDVGADVFCSWPGPTAGYGPTILRSAAGYGPRPPMRHSGSESALSDSDHRRTVPLLADLHALRRKPRELLRLLAVPWRCVSRLLDRLHTTTHRSATICGRCLSSIRYAAFQIESSYATVMMLAIPADQLRCYYGYGSWNLGGAWEAELLAISSWLLRPYSFSSACVL